MGQAFYVEDKVKRIRFFKEKTHFSSLETMREKSEMRELLSAFFDDPRSSVDRNSSGQ